MCLHGSANGCAELWSCVSLLSACGASMSGFGSVATDVAKLSPRAPEGEGGCDSREHTPQHTQHINCIDQTDGISITHTYTNKPHTQNKKTKHTRQRSRTQPEVSALCNPHLALPVPSRLKIQDEIKNEQELRFQRPANHCPCTSPELHTQGRALNPAP